MERSKAGTKYKISPDGLSLSNQNTIIINITWYSIRYGEYNENQLTKNKMDLNNLSSLVALPNKHLGDLKRHSLTNT